MIYFSIQRRCVLDISICVPNQGEAGKPGVPGRDGVPGKEGIPGLPGKQVLFCRCVPVVDTKRVV